jgi:hypothetical protein
LNHKKIWFSIKEISLNKNSFNIIQGNNDKFSSFQLTFENNKNASNTKILIYIAKYKKMVVL